ncbi:MAG: class I SAM-dependent DNA methyltransferase [Bacteroidales bacterium]|nr:MAG: class I SAM-dependent DNA methyltransferase [Bacteroidales bacterium]
MALGWNEIKERAVKFSKEWEDTSNEEADAKPFLVEFFNVFGISSRKVATFEHKVKKLDEHDGYIDLLWKGTILIEMKSRGKNLDKAYQQAKDYTHGLKQFELPKYILISDFNRFRLYDLDESKEYEFELKDLVSNVHKFSFIAGYQKQVYKAEDPVNIEAAYLMGKLHDALKESGYTGHELEKYLVRLLFCLFAEDTTIFEQKAFQEYIENKTNEDGTDLGLHLAQIFQVLNTPYDKRQLTLDESLAVFPYVNGQLFSEQLSFASFNSKMRQTLLECCGLNWSKISPAIFGSMFQSVMDETERRNLGAHYTSEKNILKLIKPLFLDKLWQEYETVKTNPNKLKSFHRKVASLRFLDPACGCGNFLVITYRELRLLELEILKTLQGSQRVTDIANLMLCDVDRFYGIEYEEFPAQIAQVALWLIDHQMNMLVSQEFGEYFVRLPLRKSAKIIHGNALRTNWDSIIESLPWDSKREKEMFDYILGNPPFIGKTWQNDSQRSDLKTVFNDLNSTGDLDYVTAWYKVACDYLNSNPSTKVAFVSTNSISQGEQVLVLWEYLYRKYEIEICFAHRTFKWNNEAKGNANVHVVIIGFGKPDGQVKYLYDYDSPNSDPHIIECKYINSYLLPNTNLIIKKQQKPICNVPEMRCGNKPSDGGHLILNKNEVATFFSNDISSKEFIRKYVGSDEYLNNKERWCIWLKGVEPSKYRGINSIMDRINKVRDFRIASTAEPTKKAAEYPSLFFYISQPIKDYIVIPEVSSERRKYIPLSILKSEIISSNKIFLIDSSELFYLGVLSSIMHMSWVRIVAGRMKSDYSYSGSIVYNTFPWPENPTEKQKKSIEKAAQKVLDTRLLFPESSLADLYDPLTMPPSLFKAHQELDKAVDLAYRPQPFINETKRIEFLFELYDKYTAGLFAKEKKSRKN